MVFSYNGLIANFKKLWRLVNDGKGAIATIAF